MTKVFRKIAFLTQFGLTMLIPTCLLFFLGLYLDKRLGTSCLCIVLFFVGAAGGITAVWKLVQKELKGEQKDVRNRDAASKDLDVPPSCEPKTVKKSPKSSDRNEG